MKLRWHERWQTSLVLGLLMVLGSVYLFQVLAAWEADPAGRPLSMPGVGVVLYRVGGKWLVSGLPLAFGVALLANAASSAAHATRQGRPTAKSAGAVRIVGIPPGDAPEAVRQAWVGLVLPLAPGESGSRPAPKRTVLARPLEGSGRRAVPGQGAGDVSYVVPVDAAIAALAKGSPEAAEWWRQNTPHLIGSGRTFSFAAEVCEPIVEPNAAPDRGGA